MHHERSDTALPSPSSVMGLITGRRSIRRYKPDPVPYDMLEQVLEAGRWAPSASNRQPWAFVLVRDPNVLRQVSAHAAFGVVRWAAVEEAPALIALCGHHGSRVYRRFLHEDIGLAGGHMMLQARALGLGTCWIGGLDGAAVAAILRVPEGWEVVALLAVGFPDESPAPSQRKPLPDLVHYDVFGNHGPDASPQAGRPPGGVWRIILRHLALRVGGRSTRREGQR